jgi:hypothetical protein
MPFKNIKETVYANQSSLKTRIFSRGGVFHSNAWFGKVQFIT